MKKILTKRNLWLVAAPLLLAAGVGVMMIGNTAANPVIIVLGVVPAALGVMCIRQWLKGRQTNTAARAMRPSNGGVKKDGPPANSLNIYPDHVEFEYVNEPVGMMQKCYNDAKFYFVHLMDGDKPTDFELPDDDNDQRYYDPREFANVVTMPSNKKYYTWSASTKQKIYVGIMVIFGVGMIIGLIATQ